MISVEPLLSRAHRSRDLTSQDPSNMQQKWISSVFLNLHEQVYPQLIELPPPHCRVVNPPIYCAHVKSKQERAPPFKCRRFIKNHPKKKNLHSLHERTKSAYHLPSMEWPWCAEIGREAAGKCRAALGSCWCVAAEANSRNLQRVPGFKPGYTPFTTHQQLPSAALTARE